MATVFGQSSGASQPSVSAISHGGVKRLEPASVVSGARHSHFVGPLLHDSPVVCCGRAVPLLWRVLEHDSPTVAFGTYQLVLRKARWLLRQHRDLMLLAD